MSVRDRVLAGLARQLRRPSGPVGHLVANRLNRANARVLAPATALLGARAGDSVADIGFGGGVTLGHLLESVGPSGQVFGLEISDVALARARRDQAAAVGSGRLNVQDGSLTLLPLPEASLDGALTVNTLYFVDDLPAAVEELHRVLRPGGRLVIGIGDPQTMRRLPYTAHGFRLRPAAEVIAACAAGGLELTRHDRVGGGNGAFHLLLLVRT